MDIKSFLFEFTCTVKTKIRRRMKEEVFVFFVFVYRNLFFAEIRILTYEKINEPQKYFHSQK